MASFGCKNCGGTIVVGEGAADQVVVCPECNMEQAAPAEARLAALMPHAIERAKRRMQERSKVPDYGLAMVVAVLLMWAGVIVMVLGVGCLFARSDGITFVVLVSGGMMMVAVALILRFARQIARQTYQAALDV